MRACLGCGPSDGLAQFATLGKLAVMLGLMAGIGFICMVAFGGVLSVLEKLQGRVTLLGLAAAWLILFLGGMALAGAL
jgi:hypothetical protein